MSLAGVCSRICSLCMSMFFPGTTPGNADRTPDPLELMSHRVGQFVGMLSWKDGPKAVVRGGY